MEALSGVASGMAVGSLSIQLIESVSKIRAFIKNVKGAPVELERLEELLARLAAVLQDVRSLYVRSFVVGIVGRPRQEYSSTLFKH